MLTRDEWSLLRRIFDDNGVEPILSALIKMLHDDAQVPGQYRNIVAMSNVQAKLLSNIVSVMPKGGKTDEV